jgi:hypothetical protein
MVLQLLPPRPLSERARHDFTVDQRLTARPLKMCLLTQSLLSARTLVKPAASVPSMTTNEIDD